MSTEAIVMMVIAMVLLWGGMFIAVLNLRRGDRAHRDDSPGPT